MKKDLIKKEYVIQANNQKVKDDWHDYIRYDKKSSALKALKLLNTSEHYCKYRLIVCKSFLVQDGVEKETAQATLKTITFGKWKKPLTWTVIDEDEDRILLLCNTCVEKRSFDKNSNIYALSEIRSWLNNHNATYNNSNKDYTKIGFLNAFTDDEINRLERFNGAPWFAGAPWNDYVGVLSESEYEKFKVVGAPWFAGAPWNDYVGLLSCEEYKKYKERIPKIDSAWWLRSPGYSAGDAALVCDNGVVLTDGYKVDYGSVGVRPALWLKKDWLKKEQNKEVTC